MATFRAVILTGKIHVRSDNRSNVKIRITHNGKIAYISTDLYVLPKKFKKGIYSGDNAYFINDEIRKKLGTYEKRYYELGHVGKLMTVQKIKEEIAKEPKAKEIDFLKFTYDYMKELEAEGKTGSMSPVKTLLFHLQNFTPSLSFKQVDVHYLKAFENYLKSNVRSKEQRSINNYMRYFRLVFNKGRERFNNEETGNIPIPHYPFSRFEIPKQKSKSRENNLTVEELYKFIKYTPAESEQFARDMALLMFYLIGINTKDLYYLKKPWKDGRVYFNRFKTNREYSIKLEPEALEIVNQYPGKNGYLIDANQRYSDYRHFNKYVNIQLRGDEKRNVKGIFPTLGINKQVTTNWFRHTWATIARNKCKISKDDVALCLGHQDDENQVTDDYIEYDFSIIDESNRKVIAILS